MRTLSLNEGMRKPALSRWKSAELGHRFALTARSTVAGAIPPIGVS